MSRILSTINVIMKNFLKKLAHIKILIEGNWEIIIRGDTQIGGKKQAGKNVIEEKFNHYP